MMVIRKLFEEVQWGSKSMVALYISLLSGVAVSLQYDPGQPYYSASSIDILIPLGSFWRSLHFYASQLFFLLSVCHFLAIILNKASREMPFKKWIYLVLSIFVSLLLLFTGYILRADATGNSAGRIAENILLTIPLLGKPLDSLLFAIADEQLTRVYANHLVGLCLLWLFLSWDHLRRYTISWRQQPILTIAMILFCVFVAAPMEPESIGVFHISGPWFFIGLQEMLRYIPPFWAGIFWPLLFVIALVLLRGKVQTRKWAICFCILWLTIYSTFTCIGLTRL